MNTLFLTTFTFFICNLLICTRPIAPKEAINSKPKISFTFDDGSIEDYGTYKLESWNQLILDHLNKYELKAVLFSLGSNKTGPKGRYVLQSWNDAGHRIANHTLSHNNYNSDQVSLEDFKKELLQNDTIIRPYSNFYPYFRFPYLKEGNTKEKVDGFRDFMKQEGYKNGHVSVDASDWYINARLHTRLRENPQADLTGLKNYYLQHLYGRALFYDSLAVELTGRQINHVLLLHHNLAAALFLDDLINLFKEKGWEVLDADKAFMDEIYSQTPGTIPAGESLIWALAKQSGRFEKILRYPAEDSRYEEPVMNTLGL